MFLFKLIGLGGLLLNITKKQLRLYVKINFLILAFFVVIVLMRNLKKQGLPRGAVESLQMERSAVVLPSKAASSKSED